MNYISLYRKWRPQTFEEVVGQDHITRTLSNAIEQNRISHAYLFSGPRGTGKTTVAKILAKALNCENGPTPTPCNQCEICREITNGSSVDVLEIDAASNRGIDEIRDLREKVHFAPAKTKVKAYIIDEVHMLTSEAFNALLKTLEEPPLHVIFVLATTEPHKVIATIVSRCQHFDFRRILISDVKERLQEIAQAEKIEVDSASLFLIAKSAQGSLRDAIGTLDQLSSFSGGNITINDVVSLLGEIDLELLFELTDILTSQDTSACIKLVDRMSESGRDLKQFTKEFLEHLHCLFVIKNVDRPEEIIDAAPENLNRMQKQAEQIAVSELVRIMDVLTKTLNDMRWNPDTRLHLEMALIKAVRPEVDMSLEGLLSRVEQLERKMEGSEVRSPKSEAGKPEIQGPEGSFDHAEDESFGYAQGGQARSEVKEHVTPKPEMQSSEAADRSSQTANQELQAGSEGSEGKGMEAQDLDVKAEKRKGKRKDSTKKHHKGKDKEEKTAEVLMGEGEQKLRVEKAEIPTVEIGKVKRVWPAVLDQVKKKKISTYALLLECQPAKVENQEITLSFNDGASFHCREVEKPQNLSLIRSALKEILGGSFGISCMLNGEVDTYPPSPSDSGDGRPESEIKSGADNEKASKEETEEIVPKPHIVKLVQDSFEAEVIDEVDFE